MAGAGAIGQLVGARLQQAGHQVTLLTRPAHAEAIRGQGLRITGLTELHGHLDCITDVAQAQGRFDAIVVTAKAHQTAAVASHVAPLLAEDGIAVSLQNGFGNGPKLARFMPPARVAVATTSLGVMVQRPGLLLHAGAGPTLVGPHAPGSETAVGRAAALLRDARLDPEVHADMRPAVWRKAIVNHAVNPVAALADCANGKLLDGPRWTTTAALAAEGFAIARAAGVGLPGVVSEAQMVEVVRDVLVKTAQNRNSMVQDMAGAKPTEVEQITGRLVRLARRLGHPAFQSEDIYHHVKDREAKAIGAAASLQLTRDEVAWEQEPF